jgi:hypothetical protein
VAAGKQWIGWTTGETQAERFDLSKQVESIRAERRKSFWALDITDKSGNTTSQQVELEKLPDFVGKDLARKIDEEAEDNPDGKEYSGLDLKVGGEGMKGFYDNILPKEIGKYVKQWGASVVKSSTPQGKEANLSNRIPTFRDGSQVATVEEAEKLLEERGEWELKPEDRSKQTLPSGA